MQTVLSRFGNRVGEVNLYFRFLRSTHDGAAALPVPRARHTAIEPIGVDTQMILRANAFLVLYNLVESTVRDVIAAVSAAVKNDGLDCASVYPGIRHLWVNHRYRNLEEGNAGMGSYVKVAHDLIDDVVGGTAIELDGYRIRGNVDAKHIRDLADDWGFTAPGGAWHRAASTLDTVKQRRNALAHGLLSFVECGREYTCAELDDIRRQVVVYLKAVLRNIQRYLVTRRYLTV